ncbi:jg7059 [Pararge aegeria aegeria]|uniref:Jg7059 protein n=1 Tax=Pararge aegeria aegeria TaxID=348720 RepID=A0A8S4RGC8_9NEOP|nr:jg7059 [Pararge aegeria aegeria]
MAIANLLDVMFCSWLIFACEQLQHLKAIMKPLMELSASLDTYRPNTAELFKVSSTGNNAFKTIAFNNMGNGSDSAWLNRLCQNS